LFAKVFIAYSLTSVVLIFTWNQM